MYAQKKRSGLPLTCMTIRMELVVLQHVPIDTLSLICVAKVSVEKVQWLATDMHDDSHGTCRVAARVD